MKGRRSLPSPHCPTPSFKFLSFKQKTPRLCHYHHSGISHICFWRGHWHIVIYLFTLLNIWRTSAPAWFARGLTERTCLCLPEYLFGHASSRISHACSGWKAIHVPVNNTLCVSSFSPNRYHGHIPGLWETSGNFHNQFAAYVQQQLELWKGPKQTNYFRVESFRHMGSV